MEYLLILALLVPVAFGLAIRNALSLDRHYTAAYDRQKEAEAAENAEKTRQTEISARLTPGKSIPHRGPGEDQDLPEVPQWIQDWTDVMEGREPAGGSGSGSGNRPADVHEFPAGGRAEGLRNAGGSG